MASLDLTSKAVTLDEIVFEERNKTYGAYWLRKKYDDFVIRGLIIAGAAFTLAVASPILIEFLTPPAPPVDEEQLIEVALSTPPPPPPSDIPPPPPLPAAPPPPQVSTIKFPPPEIVIEDVPDEPPKQEELKTAAISTETVKGDENAPVFENIEVQGVAGGTGSAVVAEEAPAEFTTVEQMPTSDYDFSAYLAKNIKYPSQASRDEISGVVYINFQVGPDGLIRDVKVTKGIGHGCDEEAVRVISKMPAWNPGKQGGRAVPVRCVVPVRFRLAN
jgi:periplasmic protein TonB